MPTFTESLLCFRQKAKPFTRIVHLIFTTLYVLLLVLSTIIIPPFIDEKMGAQTC